MTYASYQQQSASEKVTLAKVKAAKRLIAWSLHSGSIYKLESFDFSVIDSITQNGVAMNAVNDLASVIANTYYNDRENKIIYLRASDSSNPNSKFISMKFFCFFANNPVTLSYDFDSGKEVYWEPLLKSTSLFGVQLDNEEQLGFALEGSGSLSLGNDRDFWDSRYEGYIFDNQPVEIRSWNRDIDVSESKILFKGYVNGKVYQTGGVQLKLKDTLSQLRGEFEQAPISEIATAKVSESYATAKQRRIYGKVYGHRPTNIDQVVNGYVLSGTVSGSEAASTVTGVGTSFLSHFSPEDKINIGEESYTVKSIASDTSLTLNDTIELTFSGSNYTISPNIPKNFTNRRWLVAGHECCQPTTTIASVDRLNRLYVNDITDIDEGDEILIGPDGSGEIVRVDQINNDGLITLAQNLVSTPSVGTQVKRFSCQNVRLNNRKLIFDRDYTIDNSNGRTEIVLDQEAEKNVGGVRSVIGSSVVFTNGTRTVTGTGTVFTSQLSPEMWIRSTGQFDFFQILSIESDTSLTLRSNASYSDTDTAQYIGDLPFNEETDILTCEVIGTTDDDTSDGVLLRTSSEIVEDILTKVGITSLNAASFLLAKQTNPAYLGFAIPKLNTESRNSKTRDLINMVNQSVFGSLVQNEDFEIEFNILEPRKPSSFLTLQEADILDFSVTSNNDRVVKEAVVIYKSQETNYESGIASEEQYTKVSDIGTWLVSSMQNKVIETVLHRQEDARIHASRWSFLLELGTNVIKVKTKLQASRLQVNDVVLISHEKLFNRVGGGKRKFAAVQSIKKSGSEVELELDDLGNAFNRVCIITPNTASDYTNSLESERAQYGYITDEYGLINNDENTFSQNLIW